MHLLARPQKRGRGPGLEVRMMTDVSNFHYNHSKNNNFRPKERKILCFPCLISYQLRLCKLVKLVKCQSIEHNFSPQIKTKIQILVKTINRRNHYQWKIQTSLYSNAPKTERSVWETKRNFVRFEIVQFILFVSLDRSD